MLVSAVSQDVLKSNSVPAPTSSARSVIQARPAWTEADEAAEALANQMLKKQGSSFVPKESVPPSTSKAPIIQASELEKDERAIALAQESTVAATVAAYRPVNVLGNPVSTPTGTTPGDSVFASQPSEVVQPSPLVQTGTVQTSPVQTDPVTGPVTGTVQPSPVTSEVVTSATQYVTPNSSDPGGLGSQQTALVAATDTSAAAAGTIFGSVIEPAIRPAAVTFTTAAELIARQRVANRLRR
jgi:hypothetical protein